jgi:hypothetical protein
LGFVGEHLVVVEGEGGGGVHLGIAVCVCWFGGVGRGYLTCLLRNEEVAGFRGLEKWLE